MPSPESNFMQDQHGVLFFANTDTEVSIFFSYLKAGRNLENFLEDYPKVKLDQVNQALEIAEDQLKSVFAR